MSRSEAPSSEQPTQRQAPTWDREHLVRQFQGIDGCSRTDAEQQVDAYAQSFSSTQAVRDD